jgi:hypothetical protein
VICEVVGLLEKRLEKRFMFSWVDVMMVEAAWLNGWLGGERRVGLVMVVGANAAAGVARARRVRRRFVMIVDVALKYFLRKKWREEKRIKVMEHVLSLITFKNLAFP